MSPGANLTATKAWGAAAAGFLAPGAVYIAANAGDGLTGTEWIIAGALCVAAGAAAGGTAYLVENKPKVDNPPRYDLPGRGLDGLP